MKQLWGSLIIGIVCIAMLRCSGPKVIAFTGNNPDFGSYYTYRIEHPASPEEPDEALEQMFRKIDLAIIGQMDTRGYDQTEVADIVVTYNLILDNKTDYRMDQTSRYNYSYPYYSPYGYNPYWFQKSEYTEGTLLVELREELGNKLVWQASLDMRYNRRSSSKKKKDPVENAFETIFSEYPYVAGKSKPQLSDNQ